MKFLAHFEIRFVFISNFFVFLSSHSFTFSDFFFPFKIIHASTKTFIRIKSDVWNMKKWKRERAFLSRMKRGWQQGKLKLANSSIQQGSKIQEKKIPLILFYCFPCNFPLAFSSIKGFSFPLSQACFPSICHTRKKSSEISASFCHFSWSI